MVDSLLKEFADKSEDYLKELRKDLFLASVMHTDNTNARVNGKTCFVFVCAAPDGKAIVADVFMLPRPVPEKNTDSMCCLATLSHHMKILCDGGLVNVRKDGKWS